MTTEPQRLQYLEAMGLTAWVGRYRLPNARPSPECEWELPEAEPAKPPGERLHALLDQRTEVPAPRPEPEPPPARHAGRARALLGGSPAAPAEPASQDTSPVATPGPEPAPAEPQQPLRFTLQVAALDGRWLIVVPSETPPTATAQRLLANLLQAAGIVPNTAPDFQTFRWPMMDELPVEAPQDEARDGLRAFVDGRRRDGWRPERILVFGSHAVLEAVLALTGGHCALLEIPGWQGPALDTLATDASAKRGLWPLLRRWGKQWRVAEPDGE
ncbi:hypothetical protein [Litchfieldella rifensis]|uniref:Uncharacterized protein n=1 Tax=Litchfieldella rifensis TaxID=762643 RepID=A0ABV7LPA9_9GAMM